MRKLNDLFTTLDGCPRCGYAYTREVGYFLMATWAVSYGVGSIIGLAIYLYMEYVLDASLKSMLWVCISAVLLVNLLFARHARSFWLAFDHFFDPHVRETGSGDDDHGGGNVPRRNPAPSSPPGASPPPASPRPSSGRKIESVGTR